MILITGASSGIGEACARAFAAAGKPVALLARRLDRLESLAKELEREHRIEARAFRLDVTDREAVGAFADREKALLDRVEVLLNNAGLAKGLDPVQSGNLDDWEIMIDTNLKGLLYLTRAVLPHLVAKKRGHVIQLGSIAGRWVYPRGNVYCATKRAVSALTETLRLDLHGTGIRVTEVSPGMVETEFSLVRLGDAAKAETVYAGVNPLTAKDIADCVLWAASRPAHVNVQEIVVYPTDQATAGVVHRRT